MPRYRHYRRTIAGQLQRRGTALVHAARFGHHGGAQPDYKKKHP
jgi:hypothetical protein